MPLCYGLLYVAFYRMRSIDLDFRSHQFACMGLDGFYGQARATDVPPPYGGTIRYGSAMVRTVSEFFEM